LINNIYVLSLLFTSFTGVNKVSIYITANVQRLAKAAKIWWHFLPAKVI